MDFGQTPPNPHVPGQNNPRAWEWALKLLLTAGGPVVQGWGQCRAT